MLFINRICRIILSPCLFCTLWMLPALKGFCINNMSGSRQGAYLELAGGYNKAIKSTSSQITAMNPPDSSKFIYKANRVKGNNVRIGAGYQWPIDSNVSWSIGGCLGYMNFTPKGKGRLDGSTLSSKYQNKISAKSGGVTARLIYMMEPWQYYGDLSAGIAKLKSSRYRMKDENGDSYGNKTVSHFLYSASLGIFYEIFSNTSLGVGLSYIDMNSAKLGKRYMPVGGTTQGGFKTKLNLIRTNISLNYQF